MITLVHKNVFQLLSACRSLWLKGADRGGASQHSPENLKADDDISDLDFQSSILKLDHVTRTRNKSRCLHVVDDCSPG